MKKQIIVCLEGTDGCGKTTIKQALDKMSNYRYIIIDRFTGSNFVYDKLYKRKNRDSTLLMLECNLTQIADAYLIYLDCNLKTQLKRLIDKKEDPKIVRKIQKSKQLFKQYLKETSFPSLTINTSKHNVEECCKKIIKFVEAK